MTDLYRKGESFNVPGFQANGMDVDEMYNAAMQAVRYVRDGNGPVIIEAKTYRYRGHSMSDPAKYRSKEEVEQYKHLDPIDHVRAIIEKHSYADENAIKEIEKRVKNKIQEISDFAANDSLPDESELYTDIFK
jgi:pyruvate dehydrogenase E1 component alpha subunit